MIYSLCDSNGKCLLNIENFYIKSPFEVEPHTHSMLEISCIKSGSGNYHIGDKTYSIAEHDVFIINNSEPHCIRLQSGQEVVNMVIHFESEFIWNNLLSSIDYNFLQVFFERSESFSHMLDRNNPSTKKIYDLLLEIEEESLLNLPASDLAIKIKLQSIFVEIIRNFDYIDTTVNSERIRHDKEAMKMAINYITENIGETIKLEDLASVAFMSPSYFSSIFKKYNGIPPFEYIAQKRIQKSIEYIKSSSLSMTEIALLCGYNNSTSFIKSFKKVTGKTPSFYRKKNIG